VAERFVRWLEPEPGATWLELGCGTGALSEVILGQAEPLALHGVEPSPGYVRYLKERVTDPRATFTVGDASSIAAPDNTYDYVVSGLVINFIDDVEDALSRMAAVAKGGRVAAYVWDYADGMEMIRYFWDAASELDPAAARLDEGSRFPVCSPEPLRALWAGPGMEDVKVVPIDVVTSFRDFDDYWTPFLGGQGPAPGYAMSLGEEARDALRELLRTRLPAAADSSISLVARAWAVTGTS
jgi:SAM-dependent methyltransferase